MSFMVSFAALMLKRVLPVIKDVVNVNWNVEIKVNRLGFYYMFD